MKGRSVRITGDRVRSFLVHVPLARDGKLEAVLDLDDYNELIGWGVFENWQLRGGQVGARGPEGITLLIARVLTDAKPGERVVFRDRDRLNLRRENLTVSTGGFAIHHDRARLAQAYQAKSQALRADTEAQTTAVIGG